MGAAAGSREAAWLTEHWNSAPSLLQLILVAIIGVLISSMWSACSARRDLPQPDNLDEGGWRSTGGAGIVRGGK
jgi:hypothetical protein